MIIGGGQAGLAVGRELARRGRPFVILEAGARIGRNGQPLLEDERTLEVTNVVWCTGFRQDFTWIDLPVFGDGPEPVHDRGIVRSVPGLYFVGLRFL